MVTIFAVIARKGEKGMKGYGTSGVSAFSGLGAARVTTEKMSSFFMSENVFRGGTTVPR